MRDDTEPTAPFTYPHCDSPSSDQPASPTFKHSLVPLEPLWANDFPHGLTPPPESLDPGELYLDYQNSIRSAGQPGPNSTHSFEIPGIRQPSTPPRTEPSPTLHKSPSGLSGGSQESDGLSPGSSIPTPEAIFPEGDVKMMDIELDGAADTKDGPGIDFMGFSDEMATQGFGEGGQQLGKTMTEFFDFESAASSPLNTTSQLVSPDPNSKFQPSSLHGSLSPQPQPFQHTFSAGAQSITNWCAGRYAGDSGLDSNSNGVTPARPSLNRVNNRKRALVGGSFDNFQDTSDEGSRPANISPPARKMAASPASGSFNFTNFGYLGLSQQVGISFEPLQPFGVQQVQLPLTLSVDQIPAKSRVETQILVKLHLSPFPKSVTKLHLPRHCISKPKLYAKPPVKKSSDMLELHASLVCASAMRKPELLQRALARARGEGPQLLKTESQRVEGADGSSGEDSDNKDSLSRSDKSPPDEESPLMGGEVKICMGCISRERKRAARKKPKQIKEEEEWMMGEPKRAVVFNNHEVREWLPTSGMQSLNGGMDGSGVLGSWEDGMIMELHMRLACYCRHQGEKEGFRVIFTIKNHEDVVIAQQITSSILITDDHKSSAATPAISGGSQDIKLVGTGYQPPQDQPLPNLFGAPGGSIPSHDNQQGFNVIGSGGHGSTPQSPPPFSQNSFSPPPPFGRNMSPASPMASTGSRQQSPPPQLPNGNHSTKKRRINSGPKVPAGLTMTRMDNPRPSFQQQNGPLITNNQPSQFQAPALNPFSTAQSPQAFWADEPMTPSGMSDHAGFPFDSAPNTNFNGLDNRSQFASPQSTRPSRAPSPSPQEAFLRAQQAAPRIPVHPQGQARHIQTHNFQAVPPEPEASQIPEISRLVPQEGTCRGGIEVTVLGRSFVPGLTVLFGGTPASYNFFFSPTTMVCLLPPNASPGPVVVSIRNVQLGTGADKVRFFTYINDADKSLMELALQIVGMKMRGTMSNPQDIARSIIEGDTGSAFSQGSPRASQDGTSGSQQHQQYLRRLAGESGFGRHGLEGTLLKFLDAMDLDESPYPFCLDLTNKARQTMLHLASILNMGRFAAALLARGASVQATDANGYTPLHFAALHRHLEIYRRLLRHNASPNVQTRNGDTAIDLAFKQGSPRGRSQHATHSRHQSRASSASSENRFGSRSRAGSSASLSAMWDPSGMETGRRGYVGVDDFFGAMDESSSGDGDDSVDDRWMRSRRGSCHEATAANAALGDNLTTDRVPPVPGVMAPPAEGLGPAAAVTAWREQIAASIQNLQNLHWNLPTMPTAADYQHIFQNPMAALQNPMARFHALMPPSPFAQDRNVVDSPEIKKGQYTWWELFSAPQAPPAYDELFPHPSSSSRGPPDDIILERGSEVDNAKLLEEVLPPSPSGSSSSASSLDVNELRYRIARGVQDMTKEQQDEYRTHARKMKKIESDRRLYFFWLPALILILIAMAMSYGPAVWYALKVIILFVKAVFEDPSSIKESMVAMASGVAVAGGFLESRRVPVV